MTQKQYSVRIYVEADLKTGAGVVLDKAQAHYIRTVMRRQPGDNILLFNGRDGEWLGQIDEVRKSHVLVGVLDCLREQVAGVDIQLVFAPVKKAQNALILQKATELGVSALAPVQSIRTNADHLREDKMHLQVIEAAEQCERLTIPAIYQTQKLEAMLSSIEDDRALIFCYERSDECNPVAALQQVKEFQKFAVLVGPEGGFTDEERENIVKCDNTHILGLGPRILRAETAVISALTLVQSVCGDWR